jgi:hypothetical protein
MTSKRRLDFFIRKLKWIDAINLALGKDHFTAHVAIVIARHMNSDTGETFVGRETIADLIGGHVRTVELSIQKLEDLGFLEVRRARGRGHVNTYTFTFPEKAVSTPPISTDTTASPSVTKRNETSRRDATEKAVPAELKGGESDLKRRSPDRPNLIDITLSKKTLDNSIEENAAAAPSAAPRPQQVAAPPAPKRMSGQDRPKTFKNRGQFEQRIAELITEAGGDGWDVLMSLDDVRVAALYRRLKNGVLTQQEINEVCTDHRRRAAINTAATA